MQNDIINRILSASAAYAPEVGGSAGVFCALAPRHVWRDTISAAKKLGISDRTLRNKLKQYKLDNEEDNLDAAG